MILGIHFWMMWLSLRLLNDPVLDEDIKFKKSSNFGCFVPSVGYNHPVSSHLRAVDKWVLEGAEAPQKLY